MHNVSIDFESVLVIVVKQIRWLVPLSSDVVGRFSLLMGS